MDRQLLEETLSKFLKAWENKSIDEVVNLLADKFEYYESPLDKPLTTKKEVAKLWEPVPKTEADVSLDFKIMSIEKDFGLFRITGTYSEEGKKYLIDRIFLLSIDEKGKMTRFMQWRESKEV